MTNPISEPSKSPFIIGEPVSGSDFFDREDILNLIKDFVLSDKRYIFLIHGQRRIGKTSLLRKIFETANREWDANPVFFNLQGHAEDPINELIVEIAKTINDSFSNRNKLPEEISSRIDIFFKTFIPKILRQLKNKKLVLLFDEFDAIGASEFIKDNEHKNMAYNAFIPFLEEMIEFFQQQNISVKFIIACGRNYKDLEENRYGYLLRFAQQSELFIFDRPQTVNLIAMAGVNIPFNADAINAIFAIAGGHPMFTQCLCDTAFRLAEKMNIREITPEIVGNIRDEVIKQNASAVLWIWHTLPDKAKIVLFIAAKLLEDHGTFNKNRIIQKAEESTLLSATDDLDETLDLLIRNKFVKHIDNEEEFTFYVEFIRKWIVLEVNREGISNLISGIE